MWKKQIRFSFYEMDEVPELLGQFFFQEVCKGNIPSGKPHRVIFQGEEGIIDGNCAVCVYISSLFIGTFRQCAAGENRSVVV